MYNASTLGANRYVLIKSYHLEETLLLREVIGKMHKKMTGELDQTAHYFFLKKRVMDSLTIEISAKTSRIRISSQLMTGSIVLLHLLLSLLFHPTQIVPRRKSRISKSTYVVPSFFYTQSQEVVKNPRT